MPIQHIAVEPGSIPELAALLTIAVMIALVSRKRVRLGSLYIKAYLAVDSWLLLRFLRPNLNIWFSFSANERLTVAYVISVLLNLSIAVGASYWLIFAAAFCQKRDWTSGRKRLLAHLPIIWVVLLVPTNPFHHLFYKSVDIHARQFGVAYWVFLPLVFAATLLPVKWLVGMAREHKEWIYKKQALIMIVSAILPVAGGILEVGLLKIPALRDVGVINLCYTANGILTAYALLRAGFLDVLPLAIQEVFLAMSDAVLVFDGEARLVQANPAARKVFGGLQPGLGIQRCAPLVGARIGSFMGLGDEEFEAALGDSVYWVRLIRIRVRSDIAGLLVILTDVTARKRVEDELRQSEERFRSLVQNASDVISVFDVDGRIRYQSPSITRVLGYQPEEMIDKTVFDFVHPEDVPHAMFALSEGIKENGSSISIEVRFRHRDTNYRTVEATGSNLLTDPSVRGIVFNSRDVTERKRAEDKIKRFAGELARSNKRLESFAYVASHDLQEPLRKVLAFSDRLDAKYGGVLGGDGVDYLQRIQKAALRMRLLIDDLLAFSRVSRIERPFTQVDLSATVAEVLSDLELQMEQSRARVEVEELGTITADPTQMRQLMQNLISNGLKFRKKDEPPYIKVGGHLLNGSHQFFVLTVEDNGIGFDEKHSERIFEPFQRLHGKDEYEGTGIGLSLCRTIAERHGGSIAAKSSPGKGSCFTVKLRAEPVIKEADHAGVGNVTLKSP